jgi:dihydroxy-acid dehydratase
VHRAGGIFGILAELDRGELLHRQTYTVHSPTLGEAIERLDVKRAIAPAIEEFYRAAPGGVRTTEPFSQSARYADLDLNRESGVIRDIAHAFSVDGGLAVLYGNVAEDGCIVKTAGVDTAHLTFTGPARIFESQDDAVQAILGDKIYPGDVVLIRYEGPKGGPGMQEMLYPTSYLKSKGLGKVCALITDGRFSGGSSGLCLCHISPEAADGGTLALVEEGDRVDIDIPKRVIRVSVTGEELAGRRKAMDANGTAAWKPAARDRKISKALQAYAAMATSAARGAVRDVTQIQK